jgi:hypothetical protein
MIACREPGDQIMKRRQVEDPVGPTTGDNFHHTRGARRLPSPLHDSHVAVGSVLWTLTHQDSTAQARRWVTPTGFELELQIWTGARVEGEEDLCWSQLFTADDALAAAALAKKRQLEATGWLEDLDTTAR